MPVDLHEYASSTYSQGGEDGIIARLVELVGIDRGFFVELGAWDGEHLSNCRALIDRGWRGCFIEGSRRRFADLSRNLPNPAILKINAWVTLEGTETLDRVLERAGVETVDLLSIDIDSDDLGLWRSLRAYRPRVVVIEYNPTIPFDCRFENPPGQRFGNAALAIFEHALVAGYRLVAGTADNLIFLADEADPDGVVASSSLQAIKDRLDGRLPRFFFGFDGTLLTESPTLRDAGITELYFVPWSRVVGRQPLPRWLRGYGDQGSVRGAIRRVVAPALGLIQSPVQMARLLRRRLEDRAKRARRS